MKNELEKRLRQLENAVTGGGLDLPAWARKMMHDAADIGAEIEREECAALVDREIGDGWPDCEPAIGNLSNAIRARGSK